MKCETAKARSKRRPAPATVAVGNRRLLKLADFLDTVPRSKFDIALWVGDDWGGAPDLSCGTVACALGWATAIPAFRKLGIKLTLPRSCNRGFVCLEGEERRSVVDGPERAAQHLFALDEDGFCDLFLPSAYDAYDHNPTPKQVARHIRRFVEKRS